MLSSTLHEIAQVRAGNPWPVAHKIMLSPIVLDDANLPNPKVFEKMKPSLRVKIIGSRHHKCRSLDTAPSLCDVPVRHRSTSLEHVTRARHRCLAVCYYSWFKNTPSWHCPRLWWSWSFRWRRRYSVGVFKPSDSSSVNSMVSLSSERWAILDCIWKLKL